MMAERASKMMRIKSSARTIRFAVAIAIRWKLRALRVVLFEVVMMTIPVK